MLSPKLIVSPIDFSLPFIPESLTSLAHTPIYATLSAEERLAYNQTFALYVNEQTAYFEQTLSDFMLAIANLKEAHHLRSQVLQIVVEEQRHASGFLSFNRRLRPDLYAEDQAAGGGANPAASGEHVRNIPHGKCCFVRPHPVVSRLVGGLLRFPKLFPFPLWVMMLLEERSLYYTDLSNQQSHLLEPNFVRLNQLHAEDEDHHVAVDEQLISLLWDSLPWPLKRLNAWLLGKIFSEYLYYPKRAALEILRVCFSDHPKLALMSQQVLELRHNRDYLANLYNRTTNPKTLAMMDSRPELAGMAEMMEGYR